MQQLKTSLPKGLRLIKTYDLAEFVVDGHRQRTRRHHRRGRPGDSRPARLPRERRLTIVAASTLPLTVVATFFFMWLFGESINLMSMGGLAVAIGLVIDDAVVVVENIHRRVKEGGSRESIEEATKELVAPVVGSTLTTVVVFAPLGLLSGVVGQFFKALSLTLSVAVLISLVARAVSDSAARALHAARADRRLRPSHARDTALQRGYLRTLPPFLHHPIGHPHRAGGPGGAGVFTYLQVGTGFLPAADEGGFVIDYLAPAGMALEDTDQRLREDRARSSATRRRSRASSAGRDRRWACSRRR